MVRVRFYAPADAEALSILFRRSVLEIGPRDYTGPQVAAWASRVPGASSLHRRLSDGRVVMVAVDETDRPVGFADLEADGHIDLLYCAPEAVGTGAAHAIILGIEREAARLDITRLHTEASEAAKRFFLKHGFTLLHRREFVIDGTRIHNFAMEKSIGRD